MPHTGTRIPAAVEAALASPWLARKDTDWWIERLYGFAGDLDATTVRTGISRTVIDPNRDPSGASLYPGQATTELCPTTSFDGEPLYRAMCAPFPGAVGLPPRASVEPCHRTFEEGTPPLPGLHPALAVYACSPLR